MSVRHEWVRLVASLTERHIGYPVLRNGDFVGMVTLDDVGAVEEVEQDAYCVGDIISIINHTLSPDADAMTTFQQRQQNGVGSSQSSTIR